ncbi:MAG: ABC transporter ATP-binding protein [bacterium]|nr:ABC transporter ATP-binding protein [bacterium]
MTALEYRDIVHGFDGRPVLDGVSLQVKQGEFVCLLGPSGCGKTTLLRLAAGLEIVQSGSILLDDKVVASKQLYVPPEQRSIGLMFQDYALFPHLTVMENILFGLGHGERSQADKGRSIWARNMLAGFGLTKLADHYPGTLSGGEQQRVALLRALAPNPPVLLLDEPFSSLDAARRIEMREETVKLIREAGTSAIMVTHDGEEAMFMADRIKVMNKGRIVQSGKPEDIYLKPKNAFVASLFGHANRYCETVSKGYVETPLGRFKARDLDEGTSACIFIRPEGVIPYEGDEETGEARDAEVVSSHYLGIASHIHLRSKSLVDGASITFHAQRSGHYLPRIGSRTNYRIDPAHVFVFGKENDGE